MSIDTLLTKVDDQDLADIKNFCKVDEDYEDSILKGLILSARRDVIGQVGSKIDDFFDDNWNFKYAVWLKVYHSYNNRDTSSIAMTFEVLDTYQSTVNALKDDYRYRMWVKSHKKEDEQQ